jgi:hypothetical protein
MKFIKTRASETRTFFLIFLLASIAFLNPAPAEEKAEGGAPAGEAGAEGGAEGGEAVETSGGNRSDKQWATRTNKLDKLEQQIKDGEKKVKDLIAAKNGGHHAPAAGEAHGNVLDEIVTAHRDMKKAMEDYEVEKRELVYRFPEEGALINRRYLPMRPKTLDQLEKELGLDGELTRLKQNIDKKYVSVVGLRAQEIKQADKGPESTLKDVRAEKEKRRVLKSNAKRSPASEHEHRAAADSHQDSSHGDSGSSKNNHSESGTQNHKLKKPNSHNHGKDSSTERPLDEDINDESGPLRLEN